jgi:hypothetical protein
MIMNTKPQKEAAKAADPQARAAQIRAKIARLEDELNQIFNVSSSPLIKETEQPESRGFAN